MLTDKRIIKTRGKIKNAFMNLVMESDAAEITISDLTEKAGINRSTFYLHYKNIDAVIKDIDEEIQKKIKLCIESLDVYSVYDDIYSVFAKLTEMLNEAPAVKNYILDSSSSLFLIARIKEILYETTVNALKKTFPQLDISKVVYPLTFAASGIIDSYVKWAHSDGNVSMESLIETVNSLTQSIFKYINLF